MGTVNENRSLDERLDRLLRARSLQVREDFNKRTLERLRESELALDAELDRRLSAFPVEVGAAFEERVFARIRSEERGRSRWWAPLMTAAALLALSVGIMSKPPGVDSAGSQMASAGPMPYSSVVQELAIDPQLAQLFALAEGLGPEARVLLKNPDFPVWLAMAE